MSTSSGDVPTSRTTVGNGIGGDVSHPGGLLFPVPTVGPLPHRGEDEPDPVGDAIPWGSLLADGDTVPRYWSHVLRLGPTDCWWWTGSLTDPNAHAKFRAGSRRTGTSRVVLAHLLGYRIEHGPDALPRGTVVRHRCDEPPCQNPAHWLPGTRGDNNRDAAARRRLAGHALADVRGPLGRARAVQSAIIAADRARVRDAIAAALAAGNPSGATQDSLF